MAKIERYAAKGVFDPPAYSQAVKVTMRFRGRELAHQELGMNVLMRVRDDLDGIAKIEQMPRMEGRQMTMVVAPR